MTDTGGKENLALVDQVDVQPVKPRSNKKAETPKEMFLCVLCGVILSGGGLIAAIALTVRKYQGSVSEYWVGCGLGGVITDGAGGGFSDGFVCSGLSAS